MKKTMSCLVLVLACLSAACAGNEPEYAAPRIVDIKLNQSDSTVTEGFGSLIQITWTSAPTAVHCSVNGLTVPPNGSASARAVDDTTFTFDCTFIGGGSASDQVALRVDESNASKAKCLVPPSPTRDTYPVLDRPLTRRDEADLELRPYMLKRPWRGFNQKRRLGQECFTFDFLPAGTMVFVHKDDKENTPVYKADCGNRLITFAGPPIFDITSSAASGSRYGHAVPSPSPTLAPPSGGSGGGSGGGFWGFVGDLLGFLAKLIAVLVALAILAAVAIALWMALRELVDYFSPGPVPPPAPAPVPAPTTPVVPSPAPQPPPAGGSGPRPVPPPPPGGQATTARVVPLTSPAPAAQPPTSVTREDDGEGVPRMEIAPPPPSGGPAEVPAAPKSERRFVSASMPAKEGSPLRVTSSGFSRVDVAVTEEDGLEVYRLTVFSSKK